MITSYQAKYIGYKLTTSGSGIDKIIAALTSSSIDLKPHQINAALFALRSPFSQGVILADEVGLGKTIEAGLLLSHYWHKDKRRLIVICPASLRKQWLMELTEKFNLRGIIVDREYLQSIAKQDGNPLIFDGIVIMSYHFASGMNKYLQDISWDLCVFDEAHKLRNMHSTQMAPKLYNSLRDCKKLLLTATPLQNSLLELYGLASFIDRELFGSDESFKINYIATQDNYEELQSRLQTFVHRTLRREVLEYIKYTNRHAIVFKYMPSEPEERLYNLVSAFTMRRNIYSITSSNRVLLVMMIRKRLASSTRAVMSTLNKMRERLITLKNNNNINQPPLNAELEELQSYIDLASSIKKDMKAEKLLSALQIGFARMRELNASQKVVIFTESIKTQFYLLKFLENHDDYKGQIVIFNGKNDDKLTNAIYTKSNMSGSRESNIRQVIIDHFREHAKIMIATEAAAEGLNLQFCSMLVNYDMPWNPQRVEQRIGRCHRYGQKFDVIVINFLNEINAVEHHIYDVLANKFKLFDGIFGASNEILGHIKSGIDFERRVRDMLANCRDAREIDMEFIKLQKEFEDKIASEMSNAKEHLKNFSVPSSKLFKEDPSIIAKLKKSYRENLWHLTKYILNQEPQHYYFNESDHTFCTISDKPRLVYHIVTQSEQFQNVRKRPKIQDLDEVQYLQYSVSTQLGKNVVSTAKNLPTEPAHLIFRGSSQHKKGWLKLSEFVIAGVGKMLFVTACDEHGEVIDDGSKLLDMECTVEGDIIPSNNSLDEITERAFREFIEKQESEYKIFCEEEIKKIQNWAQDVQIELSHKLQEIDVKIKQTRSQMRKVYNMSDRTDLQDREMRLIKERKQRAKEATMKLNNLEEARDQLIGNIQTSLKHKKRARRELFTVSFEVRQ